MHPVPRNRNGVFFFKFFNIDNSIRSDILFWQKTNLCMCITWDGVFSAKEDEDVSFKKKFLFLSSLPDKLCLSGPLSRLQTL
jgi:hypothetical protein